MDVFYIVIISVLLVVVLFLSFALLYIVEKTPYISEKDKEFIKFTIEMYIEYANEFGIHSEKQHEKIVKKLQEINNKYFKKNGRKHKKNN
jgi:uncharacterized protein YpmB